MSEVVGMEVIKLNASHHKLLCPCGREFWTTKDQIARCPYCGLTWDGVIPRYVKVSLQAKRGESYVVIHVSPCTSGANTLADLFAQAVVPFYLSTGIKAQEITYDEYRNTDLDQVDRDCKAYLSALTEYKRL